MANTTTALPLARRARSKLMMGLSIGSAALGLVMLAIILGTVCALERRASGGVRVSPGPGFRTSRLPCDNDN